MSWATIGGLSDEQVDALMLPHPLAERPHAALGEALAHDRGASDV